MKATGLSAGDEVVVAPEFDEPPRASGVPLDLADALSE